MSQTHRFTFGPEAADGEIQSLLLAAAINVEDIPDGAATRPDKGLLA